CHLLPGARGRIAWVLSAARLHRAALVRAFRLLRRGRLRRGAHDALSRGLVDGVLPPGRDRMLGRARGAVRRGMCAPYADLLGHPDTRALPGAVDARLQVLLDHRRPPWAA